MLGKEEIIKIINDALPPVPNKLEIIQQYLLDKDKGVIKINTPVDGINHALMEMAYGISREYYLDKYKNNGS
tara:strand:+ start:49 stop:264 length:216 start_codon:yes stop_codon:yes gene_type:complete